MLKSVDIMLSCYLISLLTLPLLFLDLIRVIHAAAPGIKSLHAVHDLRKALHILGLLFVHHDGIDQVKMHQADHLILCRLIESMLDIPAQCSNNLGLSSLALQHQHCIGSEVQSGDS